MTRKEVIACGGVRERLQQYQDELLKKKEYEKRIEVEVAKLNDSFSDINLFESPVRSRSKDKLSRGTTLPTVNKLDSSLVFEFDGNKSDTSIIKSSITSSRPKSPMRFPLSVANYNNNNDRPQSTKDLEEKEAKERLIVLLLEVSGISPEELTLVLSFEDVRRRYLEAVRKLNPPDVDLPLRSEVGNTIYKAKRNMLFEEQAANRRKYRQLIDAWDRFERIARDRPSPLAKDEQNEIKTVREVEDHVVDSFAIAAADVIEQVDSDDDDDENDLMKWVDEATTLRQSASKRREFRNMIEKDREEAAKKQIDSQQSTKAVELADEQSVPIAPIKSKKSKWLEEARRLRNEVLSRRNSLRESKGLPLEPIDDVEGTKSDEEVVEVACDLKSTYREEIQKRNLFDDEDNEDDHNNEERRKWVEEAHCLREKVAKKVAREVEEDPTIQSMGTEAEITKGLLEEAKKLRAEALADKREKQIQNGDAHKSVFEEDQEEIVEKKEYKKKAWFEHARALRAEALAMRQKKGDECLALADEAGDESKDLGEVVAVAEELETAYKKEISKNGIDDLSDSDDDVEWIEESQTLQEKAKIQAEKDQTDSGETQEQKRKRFLEEAKKKRAAALAFKRGEQILEGSAHKSVFAQEKEAKGKEKWREDARRKRKEALARLRKQGATSGSTEQH